MKVDISLGVCFDNSDPKNSGRIRVIPISVLGNNATLSDILNFIQSEDILAANELKYKPWFNIKTGNFKESDKYLCEPFLPKTISLIPRPGQLVKILSYSDSTQKNEYVGPYTLDQISLTEEYRNVIKNLQTNVTETITKHNNISGYNNEQVVLGDDKVIIRVDHINQNTKKRKDRYPFVQLSKHDKKYSTKNVNTTTTETTDVFIDHVCEIFLDYTPKKTLTDKCFNVNLILYKTDKIKNSQGLLGLTKNTYNKRVNYIDKNTNNYLVKYEIKSSDIRDVNSIIDAIVLSLTNNNKLLYYNNNIIDNVQLTENKTTKISVNNNITITPNAGGGVESEPNIITNLKNWIFRLAPGTNIGDFSGSLLNPNKNSSEIDQVRYVDFIGLNNFITKYKDEKNFGLLQYNNTKTTNIVNKTKNTTNEQETILMTYADKHYMINSSSNQTPLKKGKEGVDNLDIDEYLSNNETYGFVRAEKLMELLFDIVDVFAKHGHEIGKDPRGSIIESTRESVDLIKKKIRDELTNNQNNKIVNHSFRIN